jgi:DNA-binding MarR family transcriptional regulator
MRRTSSHAAAPPARPSAAASNDRKTRRRGEDCTAQTLYRDTILFMLGSTTARSRRIGDPDYQRLLEFRTGLRRFLHWSEEQAQAAGVSPAQHQLLLAIRGHRDARGPTIGDVAEYLLLRHHSAVELVDRAVTAGLVRRRQDRDDHRVVRLQLTPRGAEKLRRLTAVTLEELARLSPRLRPVWSGLEAS